jgi:gamma-glutamyl phosphate reductase
MIVQLVTNRVVKFIDPFHSTEYYSIFQAQKVVNVLLPSGRIWAARLNDIDTNAIVPSLNVIAY